MKNSLKFQIERQGTSWAIVDPDNAQGSVRIEQAVVDATFVGDNKVEGFVLAVHGLDFEIASHLDRPTLAQLGVAANLRSLPPPPRPGQGRRVRLEQDGRITDVGREAR